MLRKIFVGILATAALATLVPNVSSIHNAPYALALATTSPTPSPTPLTYTANVTMTYTVAYGSNQTEVAQGILGAILSALHLQGIPSYHITAYTIATPSPTPTPTATPTP